MGDYASDQDQEKGDAERPGHRFNSLHRDLSSARIHQRTSGHAISMWGNGVLLTSLRRRCGIDLRFGLRNFSTLIWPASTITASPPTIKAWEPIPMNQSIVYTLPRGSLPKISLLLLFKRPLDQYSLLGVNGQDLPQNQSIR